MTPHFSAARAAALGIELKVARLRANLTQDDVARNLGRARSHVSRWERGELLPTSEDTASMLTLYGITDEEERNDYLRLAREAADPNWVSPGVGRRMASLIETERVARLIANVEPLIIPGLCQTEEYARALMVGSGATREQVDQRVQVRLGRQAILLGDGAPEYVAVVGEHALRYGPCARPVMIGQLQKLLTLAERPNVSILVLPFDLGDRYSDAHLGPFVLMEPRSGETVVVQEHLTSTTTLTNTRDARRYRAAVEDIRRQAMNGADSAAFIRKLLREMERA